tara:strand:- start:2532 stop:2681 length:150 start_codon:yes stop_codon:yes gene_type:complete
MILQAIAAVEFAPEAITIFTEPIPVKEVCLVFHKHVVHVLLLEMIGQLL